VMGRIGYRLSFPYEPTLCAKGSGVSIHAAITILSFSYIHTAFIVHIVLKLDERMKEFMNQIISF